MTEGVSDRHVTWMGLIELCTKVLSKNLKGQTHRRVRHIWEHNIKTDYKEIWCVVMD
jgi:hypothetical protein